MSELELLQEAIQLVSDVSKLEITTTVETKLLKTGNPIKSKVISNMKYYILLDSSFKEKLNKNYFDVIKDKYSEDNPKRETWFKTFFNAPNATIVQHKTNDDSLYLQFIPHSSEFINYEIDGVLANEEQIEIIQNFKQTKNQSTSDELNLRLIKLENIKGIKLVKRNEE